MCAYTCVCVCVCVTTLDPCNRLPYSAPPHRLFLHSPLQAYKKGLESAIVWASSEEDCERVNGAMSVLAIMNGFQHCDDGPGMRPALNRVFGAILAKQKKCDIDVSTLDKAAEATSFHPVLYAAQSALARFGGVGELSMTVVDKFNSEFVTSLTEETKKAKEKADSLVSETRGKATVEAAKRGAAHIGTAVSVVSALFDPTGLSLLAVAGSAIGSGVAEDEQEKILSDWRIYYCPGTLGVVWVVWYV